MQRAEAALEGFLETCEARRDGLLRRVVDGLRRDLPEGLPATALGRHIDRFLLRHDHPGHRLVCQRLLNFLHSRERSRVQPLLDMPVRSRSWRR